MKRLKCLYVFLTAGLIGLPAMADGFSSTWDQDPDRPWVGASYWANRLQDWQVQDGRLECRYDQARLPLRTVHLLTTYLADQPGGFDLAVRVGPAKDGRLSPTALAGFLVGAGGGEMDYRAAALIQSRCGPGAGILAGVNAYGQVVLQDNEIPWLKKKPSPEPAPEGPIYPDMLLTLHVEPLPDGSAVQLDLQALDAATRTVLSRARKQVPVNRMLGGLGLVSHPGTASGKQLTGRFWFRDWKAEGPRLRQDPDRAFGPVLCTQYTLAGRVMKMTAQLPLLGEQDVRRARLETRKGSTWTDAARADIAVPGWTATFRVEDWPADRDTPFRVVYDLARRDGSTQTATWGGTVRRDPVNKKTLVVAGFTGNHNIGHNLAGGWGATRNTTSGDFVQLTWFPHADLTSQVEKHRPDLLFFSGDQVYEGASPTFADSAQIIPDYLYKWYLWCWAYRDLCRDIPAVTVPDDHDVFQGNIWGEGGRKSPGRDHHGGYVHPAEFVQVVERTQTRHLPDPWFKEPLPQGLSAYYTDFTYGRIGFAVLEDRKFKSGCARPEMPPSGTGRPDHFNDPDFDIARLDIPGVQLLGEEQLRFLRHFAGDWSGQDMKIALSQTIFANMATHHGPGLQRLLADLDSNGWPQTGRNKALAELRRGFVFHLGGDQHLATIVHHGIEQHGDAIWSFCVPSVANFYPRAWAPKCGMPYAFPEPEDYLGTFRDGFGHPVTVHGATNPGRPSGHEPADLHDNMPGYGIVKMNKADRTITMECWPRWADPDNSDHAPYPGWPKTIHQTDNYARKPLGWLPEIKVKGMKNPVVKVIDETTGDLVYALRIRGSTFRPPVFTDTLHTVWIGDTGSGWKKFPQLQADPESTPSELTVSF